MSSNYVDYILEILSPYGDISARSMFGGYGIYKSGTIFALIVDDELYFKVDASNKAQYEKLDSEPFTYEAKGKKASMSYWKVPMEILEDEEQLGLWLDQSHEISLQTKRVAKKKNK
jgi:DNA transformation protein and related proteins